MSVTQQNLQDIVDKHPINGKYSGYTLIKVENKIGGAERGRTATSVRINNSNTKKIKFIDKVSQKIDDTEAKSSARSLFKKFKWACHLEKNNNYEAISEKICLDFHRIFSNAASSRIGTIDQTELNDIIHRSLDQKHARQSIIDATGFGFQRSQIHSQKQATYLIFRSKLLDNYSDLGSEVVNFIMQHERPPEEICYNNRHYPLTGLMEVAAVAKILGDCDWLGGGGGNTGYTFSATKKVCEAIMVDAGNSLNITTITDLDIPTNPNRTATIKFDKLTAVQRKQYLSKLKQLCQLKKSTLKTLVYREGLWNRLIKNTKGSHAVLLSEDYADVMVERIMSNIQAVKKSIDGLAIDMQMTQNLYFVIRDITSKFIDSDLGLTPANELKNFISKLNGLLDEDPDLLTTPRNTFIERLTTILPSRILTKTNNRSLFFTAKENPQVMALNRFYDLIKDHTIDITAYKAVIDGDKNTIATFKTMFTGFIASLWASVCSYSHEFSLLEWL